MVLTKCSHLLRKVTTPFLFESQRMSPVSKPASDASEASWSTCPWRKHQYVGGCAPKTCTICMRSIRSRGGIVTTSASEERNDRVFIIHQVRRENRLFTIVRTMYQ